MKKYGLLSLFFLVGATIAFRASAQDQQSDDGHEEIIIRKKGSFPQKLDIQLNGNQVTINGKKPEDVKGNIEVIRRKSSDQDDNSDHSRGSARSFHGFPRGMHMFGDDSDAFGGDSNKALLGVLTIPSDSAGGARIAEVERGTPADSAGLAKNDVITKIGTQDIHSAEDLSNAIGQYKPGDVITVTYQRGGTDHETDVALGRNDNGGGNAMVMPFDHYSFQSPFEDSDPQNFMKQFRRNHPFLSPEARERPKLGMRVEERDDHKGVTVKQVTSGSAADASGFKVGDVLTSIAGKDVSGVNDVLEALRDHRDDKSVEAKVERSGKEKTLQVEIPGMHQSADL